MESRDLHYLTAHNDISIILTGLQRSSLKCKREIGNKLVRFLFGHMYHDVC